MSWHSLKKKPIGFLHQFLIYPKAGHSPSNIVKRWVVIYRSLPVRRWPHLSSKVGMFRFVQMFGRVLPQIGGYKFLTVKLSYLGARCYEQKKELCPDRGLLLLSWIQPMIWGKTLLKILNFFRSDNKPCTDYSCVQSGSWYWQSVNDQILPLTKDHVSSFARVEMSMTPPSKCVRFKPYGSNDTMHKDSNCFDSICSLCQFDKGGKIICGKILIAF